MVPVLSSLLYFAAVCAALSYLFRSSVNRKNQLLGALTVVVALFSAKLLYDINDMPKSHYNVLEVGRHDTTLDIRRNYKRLSKIHHPDKQNDPGFDHFQSIKTSYDILMNEEQRDIYNRFGGEYLEFDPRKDEIKLIADIAVDYLLWLVLGYLMTIPVAARASRTWLSILGIGLVAIEVAFKLTDTTVPDWMPERLTEHEFVCYMHCCFPLAVACLRVVAESLFVDPDQTSLRVLRDVFVQQKNLGVQLQQLQELVDLQQEVADAPSQDAAIPEERLVAIQDKLSILRDDAERISESTAHSIKELSQCSANPGSGYYWIVFVVLYGGVYFLQ